VIKAAPLFDFADNGVSTHPKVDIVHSDAFRALLKGHRDYDVILSEPSNPWVTGIEQLYSREFLAEARDRLTPHGVYCQWFHRYEIDSDTIGLVLKTFASVFDHVAVWSTNRADLMLLGFRDPERALDVERLERRAQRPDFAAVLQRLGIGEFAALLAHEVMPLDVVRAAAIRGPLHSLYHPRLNFQAGRAFFVGQSGELPFTGYGEPAEIGAVNSLVRRYFDRRDGADLEPLRGAVATRSCYNHLQGCGAYAASWANMKPNSDDFRAFVANMQARSGPNFLRRMRVLNAARGPDQAPRIRPAQALDLTRLFMAEYAHGAPLEPNALLRLWERCGLTQAGVNACKPGLRVAQRLMIGDPPPAPDDWLNPEPTETALHAAPEEKPDERSGDEGDGGDDAGA
jgi:hypothetical protein